uniref:G patch domain-containing protein 4 n=1 Tax=Graphocephala atropunctata TaxID=36148 RepID=A0A1B6MQW0_9HEMI
MEFSKRYLLKYGWNEGEGLGKTQSGIKNAIKPKLKFDKAGMGYDHSLEFTDSWWEKVYNEALNVTNIQDTKPMLDTENNSPGEVNNQKRKKKRKKKLYDSDNLFEACEGRTVHKGARHGLELSGKLQRLEEQEKKLLEGNRNSCIEVIEENKSISAQQIVDKSLAKREIKSHQYKNKLKQKNMSSYSETVRDFNSANNVKTVVKYKYL